MILVGNYRAVPP